MYMLEIGHDKYVIVAQFYTFHLPFILHVTCSIASPLPPEVAFSSLTSKPENTIADFELQVQTTLEKDLSHRPRKALGLRPNIRVNQ
jgi:hypothetical protein